jgi:hypothetical protein
MLHVLVFGLTIGLAGCQTFGTPAEPETTGIAALQAPEVLVQSLDALPDGGGSDTAEVSEAADAVPEAPPVEKSAPHLACETLGGFYGQVGKGGAFTCQFPTKDGGKSCTRAGDCEGICLARSRSCAPINPLFGCNEVLQDDGRRVTLCID